MKHDGKKEPVKQPVRGQAEPELIPLEDLEIVDVKGGARLFGASADFGAAGDKAEKGRGSF